LILPLACLTLTACDDETFSCSNDSATCLAEAAETLQSETCSCAIGFDADIDNLDQCLDSYFSGGLRAGAKACLRNITAASDDSTDAVECVGTLVGNAAVCVQSSECNLIQLAGCIQSMATDLEACSLNEAQLGEINDCMGDFGL
jgi:hypothetical protein